jgi:hypothetical protein
MLKHPLVNAAASTPATIHAIDALMRKTIVQP